MKLGSTLFLKVAVILIGMPVLALCIFGLPWLAKDAAEGSSEMAFVLYGILLVMYVSAIPFFGALYHTMANLSILKNGKAKAIRLSTLEAICKALDCQPGDILEYSMEEYS